MRKSRRKLAIFGRVGKPIFRSGPGIPSDLAAEKDRIWTQKPMHRQMHQRRQALGKSALVKKRTGHRSAVPVTRIA